VQKKISHIILVFSLFISIGVIAQNPVADAMEKVSTFVEGSNQTSVKHKISENFIEINKSEKTLAIAFELEPTGFVVVNTKSNEIVAYSFDADLPDVESQEWEIFSDFVAGIEPETKFGSTTESGTREDMINVGPFVYSLWGQVNCKDNYGNTVNVTNTFTPNNYAVGCVAVSMSTAMKHYDWPSNGIGSHTYTDNYGSSRGTYSADFAETNYAWENILDRYNNKVSSLLEREDAGLLAFHAAVALDMDFEYNGSTSNVNRIPNAGHNYFRYSSQNRYPSSSVFWPLLDSNMVYQIPVVLAISGNGYGHSIICDGLKIDEDGTYFYHLNMGWWGSSNGWYRLREDWNAGGYSEITGGVFNFLPIPSLRTPFFEETSDSITIEWEYPETVNLDAFELQKSLNGESWETISDTLTQKALRVFANSEDEIKFRVRAQNNGLWGSDSWSTVETAIWDNTGIFENHNAFDISVSPNPATDNIRVNTSVNLKNCEIRIFELSGQEVLRATVFDELDNFTIDLSGLKSGFYLLQCKTPEALSSIKFIKL